MGHIMTHAPDRTYLDYAATTPLREEVRESMAPFLGEAYGNPSSLHREGREAREALEAARQTICDHLGAGSFRFAFTGGGTESDNAGILGVLAARLAVGDVEPRDLHVVTTAVEHAAVLGAVESAARWGVSHTLVPVDRSGRVDPEAVVAAVGRQTALVSVMAVNNEVGTIEPIEAIGALLRPRGVPFHVDGIQMVGKLPLDLDALRSVDLLSVSAHKISGPKGVGGLFVREELPFEGLIRGGAQEGGLRGGTENVANAVGFGRAVELAFTEVLDESNRLTGLQTMLRELLEARVDGLHCNTPTIGAAPHILSVTVEGVEGESLLRRLDDQGIAVSTGSACNVGGKKPSHVLAAMGLSRRQIRGTLRLSMGRSTGPQCVARAVEAIASEVAALRAIAP